MLVWSVNHAIQKTSSQLSQVKDVPLGRSASRRWEMLPGCPAFGFRLAQGGVVCVGPPPTEHVDHVAPGRDTRRPTMHISNKKPAVRSHIAFTVSLLSQSHIFFFLAKKTPESHPSSLCHHRQNTCEKLRIPGGLGRAPSKLSQPGSSEAFRIRRVGEGLRVQGGSPV